MIKGLLIDLGDTIIEQQVDDKQPLSAMELVAFDDSRNALLEMKKAGYRIAIISNTSQSTAKDIEISLKKLNLLDYIDTIVTSVDIGKTKPHPDIFLATLKKLNLSTDEVAMIGNDLLEDIGGAMKLGITTIFVSQRGKGSIDSKEKPTFTVSSLGEVPPLLKSILKG